jgi:hypothetical protein
MAPGLTLILRLGDFVFLLVEAGIAAWPGGGLRDNNASRISLVHPTRTETEGISLHG